MPLAVTMTLDEFLVAAPAVAGLVLAITNRRRYPRAFGSAVTAFVLLLLTVPMDIAYVLTIGSFSTTSQVVSLALSSLRLLFRVVAVVLAVVALWRGPFARSRVAAPEVGRP